MIFKHQNELKQLFQYLAELLDISETQYESAKKHYEAVGTWLNSADSPIAKYSPTIYPQGSFRLGTVIKPVNDVDEYDIDLVCELKNLSKDSVSQKQFKQLVGARLKTNEQYTGMLEEGNRCWILNYSDSSRFHMDILPAIPNENEFRLLLEKSGYFNNYWVANTIAITDKSHPNYEKIDPDWPRNNPIGYAEWFKEQMKVQYDIKQALLAESLRISIEQVPDYKIKTPLQRSIQILKRHRNIMFAEDLNDRPISIIISTLAALSYNNEPDLLEALQNIVNNMQKHIEIKNGISWVSNPVNPFENFADKWQNHPKQKDKFLQWIQQVKADIDQALRMEDLQTIFENLKPHFGDRIINESVFKLFPGMKKTTVNPAAKIPYINIVNPNKPWGA